MYTGHRGEPKTNHNHEDAVLMEPVSRRSFLGSIPAGAALVVAAQSSQGGVIPNRPKVPGTLSLRARRRSKETGASEQLRWHRSRRPEFLHKHRRRALQ